MVCPIWLPVLFYFSNEPELGAGNDPGMAWTLLYLLSGMRRDWNPQPFHRKSSLLTTRPDWGPNFLTVLNNLYFWKTLAVFGLIHTWHFGTQYFDIAIKRYYNKKDTFFYKIL